MCLSGIQDASLLCAENIIQCLLWAPSPDVAVSPGVCGCRSRERNARREARVALTHLSSSLGAPYFCYLVAELKTALGPRSEKDAAANQQGFWRPVLLFTLHKMLTALLQQRDTNIPMQEAPLLPPAAEGPGRTEGPRFIQPFEAAVPLLLPLIAEVSSNKPPTPRHTASRDPEHRGAPVLCLHHPKRLWWPSGSGLVGHSRVLMILCFC